MFDIFTEEKEQPKLYVADVSVIAYVPERKGSKKIIKMVMNMEKVPIILLNGDFPTERTKRNFMRRVYDNYIGRGKFDEVRLEIHEIKNVKFSSSLAYKFNFDVH